jgi:predicted esterase
VLVQHGIYDDVLPISSGRSSRDYLSTLPLKLDYREYEMGHQISDGSFADARGWLAGQLDTKIG